MPPSTCSRTVQLPRRALSAWAMLREPSIARFISSVMAGSPCGQGGAASWVGLCRMVTVAGGQAPQRGAAHRDRVGAPREALDEVGAPGEAPVDDDESL